MRFLIKRAVLAADKWLGWHTGEIAFNGIRYVLCWSLSHYTGGCTTHQRRYTCKNVHALLSSQFAGVGPYAGWPENRHIHLCLPVPLEVFSLMDFNYGWAGCHEHGPKDVDVDRRAVSQSHRTGDCNTVRVQHQFGEEVGSEPRQTAPWKYPRHSFGQEQGLGPLRRIATHKYHRSSNKNH